MGKKIGFIGLGKMGRNMVLNLLSRNHKVVVYNRSPEPVKDMQKRGAIGAYSYGELCSKLPKPRILVLMVTAGKAVDSLISDLLPFLSRGDILIDGGNSFYKDSIRRYKLLKNKGVSFVDMGVSGGLEGARHGASLTVGGDKKSFRKAEFLLRDLAIKNGYGYMGKSGAGHFVKMVHNGIEYALMEAYAEGFELLDKSEYKLNYKDVARVWNNGSVIRSWITELAERVFKKNPGLKGVKGIIGGGETGTWAYKTARNAKSDFKTLKHALDKRELSKKKQSFSTKLISLLRNEFGGHEIEKGGKK